MPSRFVGITGGTIRGDRLNATIDNGGADWQTVHTNGSITVDTRYSATTHDGAKLLIATRGIRRGHRLVLERLAAGDSVDPREYHFRVVADIEAAGAYRWLTERVHIGTAQPRPSTMTCSRLPDE